MPIKEFKPVTNGLRNSSGFTYEEITTSKPEKSLVVRLKKSGGRSYGKITVRHRGGGARKKYRLIDFKRKKDGVPAKVSSIEYDPNRTCRIALLTYNDGEKKYILAPNGLEVGQTVQSGENIPFTPGNCLKIKDIPVGTQVHNVEIRPGQGGKLIRSAGLGGVISAKDGDHCHLIMPSKEVRRIRIECRATIGAVGNSEHGKVKIGKAGKRRHMGWRPSVRGTAQAPVDHPMGGGEGRRAGGRHPCSPTGKLAKGGATRKRNKTTNVEIIRRRK
ncbi:MAG: 50S ribosomal protein L2 [Planctomycetota bacterium]|nr:MAG: 50S ribosomal protein L2 [Planctomycetota bacterium]